MIPDLLSAAAPARSRARGLVPIGRSAASGVPTGRSGFAAVSLQKSVNFSQFGSPFPTNLAGIHWLGPLEEPGVAGGAAVGRRPLLALLRNESCRACLSASATSTYEVPDGAFCRFTPGLEDRGLWEIWQSVYCASSLSFAANPALLLKPPEATSRRAFH